MYVCMYGGESRKLSISVCGGIFLQKFKNHVDGLWDRGTLVPRPRYGGQKTVCAFGFLLPPEGSSLGREASQETRIEGAFPSWHQRRVDTGAENKQMLKPCFRFLHNRSSAVNTKLLRNFRFYMKIPPLFTVAFMKTHKLWFVEILSLEI